MEIVTPDRIASEGLSGWSTIVAAVGNGVFAAIDTNALKQRT
jgi:hypothetical protein